MTSRPILYLTSSLATDHILRFSSFRDGAPTEPFVAWVRSLADYPDTARAWKDLGVSAEPFPEVRQHKYVPFGLLRRFNDRVWDFALPSPSRVSQEHHGFHRPTTTTRRMTPAAKLTARTGLAPRLERQVNRALGRDRRSPEAERRLRELRPSLVVVTSPFYFLEPAIAAAARDLGIPVVASITSWDNPSTKSRLTFDYDAYLVWSDQMRGDLEHFYPATAARPIVVTGAPQFDLYSAPELQMGRREFAATLGIDADCRIVVYALGSPNFLDELPGAVEFAERLTRGDLPSDVQMIVRPHPVHERQELEDRFRRFGPRVIVQRPHLVERTTDFELARAREQVNTFRHADVVVNLASTVTIDAAVCDTPVITLDYDPRPDGSQTGLIHDINRSWVHFSPVAASGGVWVTKDTDETVGAVGAYLADPSRHRAERRALAASICGFVDGRSGARLAASSIDLAQSLRMRTPT